MSTTDTVVMTKPTTFNDLPNDIIDTIYRMKHQMEWIDVMDGLIQRADAERADNHQYPVHMRWNLVYLSTIDMIRSSMGYRRSYCYNQWDQVSLYDSDDE